MRAAVLGHPVAHSLSPVLHTAAYRALDLHRDWRYERIDVDAAELPGVLGGLGTEWAGLSLTMPLKQAVFPLLAEVSELASAVGSVNTVLPLPGPLPEPGGPLRWRGDNTDVHGLVAALWEAGVERVGSAVVLGGGATAASAIAALHRLGAVAPTVHVRSPLRAGALQDVADRLGAEVDVAPWERAPRALGADVVISTTPAGATDELAEVLRRQPPSVRATGVLVDVVYAPWPTPLARVWAERGGQVVAGHEMLLHQAGEQVRLMTGRDAPLDAMRDALHRALAAR